MASASTVLEDFDSAENQDEEAHLPPTPKVPLVPHVPDLQVFLLSWLRSPASPKRVTQLREGSSESMSQWSSLPTAAACPSGLTRLQPGVGGQRPACPRPGSPGIVSKINLHLISPLKPSTTKEQARRSGLTNDCRQSQR